MAKHSGFPTQSYNSRVSLDPKVHYKTQSNAYDYLAVVSDSELDVYEERAKEYRAKCRKDNRVEVHYVDLVALIKLKL
jgi:hypothetical protein